MAPRETRQPTPVFLLAPMNRSGTKLLRSVLLAHPRITEGFALEDYSLAYTNTLFEFASAVSRHWGTTQQQKAEHRERLLDGFGPFLLDFFSHGASLDTADHLLLTTPRPWGLVNVVRLFPESRVIFVIRDGRDTVESARKSFRGGTFAHWVREWDKGAREILRFAESEAGSRGRRWGAVAFEDLARDPEVAGRSVMGLLGLDADAIDWDGVRAGPVRGSSEHGGPGNFRPKDADFNPVGRASGWSWIERTQFRRYAAASDAALKALVESGREADRTPPAPSRRAPSR